jgi:hypothetical protein
MSASADRLRDTLNNASGQPLTLESISRIALLSRHIVEGKRQAEAFRSPAVL